MNLPTLPKFTAGDQPDADTFNQFSEAVRFLAGPPEVYAWKTATQSVPNAAYTVLTMSTTIRDTDTMWSSTNPSRLSIVTPGWYELEYGVFWNTGADSQWRVVDLAINGAIEDGGGTYTVGADNCFNTASSDFHQRTCCDVFLNTGDYIELVVWQQSGGSLSTKVGALTGEHTFFHALWTSL